MNIYQGSVRERPDSWLRNVPLSGVTYSPQNTLKTKLKTKNITKDIEKRK